MTFSGIDAVQAQIAAIEQQVSAVGSPGAVGTAGSGTTTGADFASLLSDAMNVQSAVGAGGAGASSDPSASGTSDPSNTAASPLSSLLSEASALTGSSGSPGATSGSGSTALSSLLGGLTGTGAGTSNTGDLSSLLASITGSNASNGSSATGAGVGVVPNATATQFVNNALAEQGKPYVWGASASASDPNPAAFDCSELTKWAAVRTGVTIPDGAAHQYVWLKEQGATMSVQQALRTPGALLFSFNGEPQPGLSSEPAHAHVAISLGNGMTIEAKGHAYGVGVFEAGDRFNYAGMIPGMG